MKSCMLSEAFFLDSLLDIMFDSLMNTLCNGVYIHIAVLWSWKQTLRKKKEKGGCAWHCCYFMRRTMHMAMMNKPKPAKAAHVRLTLSRPRLKKPSNAGTGCKDSQIRKNPRQEPIRQRTAVELRQRNLEVFRPSFAPDFPSCIAFDKVV